MSLPQDLIDRFRRDVKALDIEPSSLGLAISGGPDSVALLLLAASAFPGGICAATVDHRLRKEGAEEARFVAELCRELGVAHVILEIDVDATQASLQQAARGVRYAALSSWAQSSKVQSLATAHHIDDQAETLLMRLLRGAGVSGLAGIRANGPIPGGSGPVRLVRPLLGWRRRELQEIVDLAGITAVDDPSNRDSRFDRVRMRGQLAKASWLDPVPLARSAAALAEADEALEWSAAKIYQERVVRNGDRISLEPTNLPAELQRRLVLQILASLASRQVPPRGEDMTNLLRRLRSGEAATLAGVKCRGGETWIFEPAPPHRRTG